MIIDRIVNIDIDKKRHLVKAITWRIVGSLDTLLITWAVTGELKLGAMVSGIETVNKIVLYYLHERAWYKINWGIKHERKSASKPVLREERGTGEEPQPKG